MLPHHTRHHYSNDDLLRLARGWQVRMIGRWVDFIGADKLPVYDETDFWQYGLPFKNDLEIAFKLCDAAGVEPRDGNRRDLILGSAGRDAPPDLASFLTLVAFVYPHDSDGAQLPIQLAWASVGYHLDERCYPAGRVRFSWRPAVTLS